MRTFAGAFARRKCIDLLVLSALGAGAVAGFVIGHWLHRLMGAWLDDGWGSVAASLVTLVAISEFWLVFRSLERGRRERLYKGEDAEVRTGQVIEHSLTAPGCAVARSVTSIARAGDIDHLVATPVRLWAVETKYRRVPRERFPEVLRRIAENTAAVWGWAPPGTPVRGCLVLAYESRLRRKSYDYGKQPVVVHTPASLARELKAEAREERTIDERVAAGVWEIGRIAE